MTQGAADIRADREGLVPAVSGELTPIGAEHVLGGQRIASLKSASSLLLHLYSGQFRMPRKRAYRSGPRYPFLLNHTL